MLQECLADGPCGVVLGRYEDGIFGEAVHENDEELHALIGEERSYDVERQVVPGVQRVDRARCLVGAAVICGRLALGATLCDFDADTVTVFMFIAVAE